MRYFFGFLVLVVLVIGVLVLVIRGFNSGPKTPKNQIVLTDFIESDAQMQYTLKGPITADALHEGVRITVSRSEARIETLKGYNEAVTQTKSYPNNQAAYAEFLGALSQAGYTKGNADPNKKDDRGQCASGERYIFSIIRGSETIQRLWSSSCSRGNFGGDAEDARNLFRQQIPDYDQITSPLSL